jgi:hypothetical protein
MWQRQDSTTDQLQSVAEALGEEKGAVLLAWVENKGPRPEWLGEALAVSNRMPGASWPSRPVNAEEETMRRPLKKKAEEATAAAIDTLYEAPHV